MENTFTETLDWLGFICSAMILVSELFLLPAILCYLFSFAIRWGNTQRFEDYIRKLRG